jgi:hypothetical protein
LQKYCFSKFCIFGGNKMEILCAILGGFFLGCVSGVGIMAMFSASKYDDSSKSILRQLPPPHQEEEN